ncbi:MAG: von Willebrand factor type A domain-containing protein, partial [Bdellovibrionales bacterium]|nr:von Willebrand factor type A domain-containing protein [Bdellovibrionales bacterium]NQZ19422.1 von Willebrand factor type A domain-containing protein [Bdellovibrionales bacterium]
MSQKISQEKLTAYALGELSQDEREQIEKVLLENPELKAEVEAIQSFGQILSQELKKEEVPQMADEQRNEFYEQVSQKSWLEAFKDMLHDMFIPVGSALGACLVLLIIVVGQNDKRGSLVASPSDTVALFEAAEDDITDQEEQDEFSAEPEAQASSGALSNQVAMNEAAPQTKSYARPMRKKMKFGSIKQGGAVKGRAGLGIGCGRGCIGGGYESYHQPISGDTYDAINENEFLQTLAKPLSTFSVDVDTASYTNLRNSLINYATIPPKDAIRIEEMINYFDYNDPQPKGDDPFGVNLEVADSPWEDGNKIVRIGIKGKEIQGQRKDSNLVFLVDVSGSMTDYNKLPLLKKGLHKLIEQLQENDRVSMVTYAGNAAVVFEGISGSNKKKLHQEVENLESGGSTHGSQGITRAYEIAKKNFRNNGVNRLILATDGDFNVGLQNDQALVDLVKSQSKSNIFLTVLGFGRGNLNDSMMEKISNKGNGNYFYLDSEKEAEKVLVKKLQGTLVTIAKDVKIQVEFNPINVMQYRLIGYVNRKLKDQDFNNDKKDAGEIGAGHSVVALYEIVPSGSRKGVDPLKYQKTKSKPVPTGADKDELLTVKLRYKQPKRTQSKLLTYTLKNSEKSFEKSSHDFRWSVGVAGFGMILRQSSLKG